VGSQEERMLQVVKMRRTPINAGVFSMNFTKNGIEVEFDIKK
jgi:KaiC/GvpD/RAD55 family RecA-like ATPase